MRHLMPDSLHQELITLVTANSGQCCAPSRIYSRGHHRSNVCWTEKSPGNFFAGLSQGEQD